MQSRKDNPKHQYDPKRHRNAFLKSVWWGLLNHLAVYICAVLAVLLLSLTLWLMV